MTSRSRLPSVKEPVSTAGRGIEPAWYRFLAKIERLIVGATETAGTGLTENDEGVMSVADDGITDEMLRNSLALSVIGNPLNVEGDPQDITAADNGRFFQRDGDLLVFRIPRIPSYTVATLPSASNQGAGTIVFCTDALNEGELAGAGTGSLAVSDGTNWKVPGTPGAAAA